MSIESHLSNRARKSSSDLEALYHQYCNDKTLVAELIKVMTKPGFEIDASWILKRHLESGHRPSKVEVAKIYQRLHKLSRWQAKLHILQCIPCMPIDKTEKTAVEVFLRSCLVDKNKFVRAWAYHGFYEISLQYPEYQDETRQFFEMAMKDEAPSVKARIRNIVKSGF